VFAFSFRHVEAWVAESAHHIKSIILVTEVIRKRELKQRNSFFGIWMRRSHDEIGLEVWVHLD